ncbi:hypothetical protein BAUCODRAFT_189575 [Baudoinia panamericana UAMH 10762]|uniref:BHLH domain-containing protein n=1 Tax=Baudoinia panamericana (strain UAMH 10762) TaxID=717646 RepID=M2N9Q3_BAUPA|nr:uncharacterized protein BAUCODRAFT_189575 [Baudoinia panamericana UAMH 10762]EMD00929.1 hypothetical protein BAUCODRAFT_189575 [Baudoinia panamericana UAMH 10762]
MIAPSKENLTVFPPFNSHGNHDSPIDFGFERDNTMGDTYIKSEPNDSWYDPNQFISFPQGQQQHFNNASGNMNMNINPASLTNGGGNSFGGGNSGIADDELLDLQFDQSQQQNGRFDMNQGMRNFIHQQQQQQAVQQNAGMQGTGLFSHTPDGAPIQSPFTHAFNFAQFRPEQQFAGGHSMPQQSASFRPHAQHRQVSDSRSPATPSIQVAEDFPGMQQIRGHRRQQGSLGGNGWDSTPSGHSWGESSPFPSPANGQPMHAQISEVLKNNGHHGKVASSLPAKMEGSGMPNVQSQEAKRRRRRESHNAVERRRRDNINERIQDLGTLLPQHRLEDEKVRKHLQTNAPLSPSITNSGMSPPAATSLLAGPQGRRATGAGNITQGLPLDDKDKGPNKGDILNGSVYWARDLMWYTHLKLRQEEQLKELVQQLGGIWPFEQSEDERRMHSEICEVINKHVSDDSISQYTRGPGSGLRVPGFTTVAGETLNGDGQPANNGFATHQAMSPGFQSGGSGMSSGRSHQQPNNNYWPGEFKEEDEYGMEMQ